MTYAFFHRLAKDCERIDILFDLYHQKSIKENKQNCKGKQAGILTYVSHDDQALPVKMDRFLLLSLNKVSFQHTQSQTSLAMLSWGSWWLDMYHLSHAVNIERYRSVTILSPDMDVLVCAVYNYS